MVCSGSRSCWRCTSGGGSSAETPAAGVPGRRRLNGQGGYITPAAWGVPTASERGAESKVAHKWVGPAREACVAGMREALGALGFPPQ